MPAPAEPLPREQLIAELDGVLDLWASMWQLDERQRFAAALARVFDEAHPPPTRLAALAACVAVATPELVELAGRVQADASLAPLAHAKPVIEQTAAVQGLLAQAGLLHGQVAAVEARLIAFVEGQADAVASEMLDWVDARDLVAVARTTMDGRLYGEIVRRLERRGRQQRLRVASDLGFPLGAQSEKAGSPVTVASLVRPPRVHASRA